MTKTHSYKGVVWIDLESPSDDEISSLVKRYDLHPLVGEELKTESSLAKSDFYKDYCMVVLNLPMRKKSSKKDHNSGGSHSTYEIVDREIDFVIGKNFLITCHYDTIEQLEYFGKIFETNSILNKDDKIEHAGYLFYYMMKKLYSGLIEDLDNIKDSIISAESHTFSGDEREMVAVLSNLSRELIDIKQTARMHHGVWEQMVAYADKEYFGAGFGSYIHDIRDQFNLIHEIIVNCRELLADLRETNDSLLNTKQNDIIKRLTMVSFIFIPITFVAALFTIPAVKVPFIDGDFGWVILLLIMILISAGTLSYFKRKKWM